MGQKDHRQSKRLNRDKLHICCSAKDNPNSASKFLRSVVFLKPIAHAFLHFVPKISYSRHELDDPSLHT